MRAAIVLAFVIAGCGSAGARQGDGTGAGTSGAAEATASDPATSARNTEETSSNSASGSASASGLAGGDAPAATGAPWAQRLAPVVFRDVNTLTDVVMRLYKDDGSIDDAAAVEVERVLWIAKDEPPPSKPGALAPKGRGSKPAAAAEAPSAGPEEALHVNRRLLQLVVKASEHFGVHEVQVISSHRGKARKGSRHRTGEAIDFVLPGVPAKKLAEVLRTYPRVGVGVYIHPKAQFVHLDVREQSYHWIDGSPPGRVWREQPLPDPTAQARDEAYTPSQDLPDGAT